MSTMAFTEMYLAAVRWRTAKRRYELACHHVVDARRAGTKDDDGIKVLAAATDERIDAEAQLVHAIDSLDALSNELDQPELELNDLGDIESAGA